MGMTLVEAGPAAAASTSTQPIFECSFPDPAGTGYVTAWGYDNTSGAAETVPIGGQNHFLPSPGDQGQPTTFAPGRHDNVLILNWDGAADLGWKLGTTTVIASTASVCPTNPVPVTGSGLSSIVAMFAVALTGAGVTAHLQRRRRAPQP